MNGMRLELLTLLGMPPVEHVRLAAELGCASISIGMGRLPVERFGFAELGFYTPWSLEEETGLRREIGAALRDTGVRLALSEGFALQPGKDVADFAPMLDIVAQLGAERVNGVSLDPSWDRTVDQLAKLADMVRAREMEFVAEFAPGTTVATLADALDLCRQAGPGARIVVDAMHCFRSGLSARELSALDPDLIGCVQLCDAPLASDQPYMLESMFDRRLPGEGELALRAWFDALPAGIEIGLEIPSIAALRAEGPSAYARRVVKSATEFLAGADAGANP